MVGAERFQFKDLKMASMKKQALRIIQEYKETYGLKYCNLDDVADWAIREGKYDLEESALKRQCKDLLGRALREERFTDAQGRRPRKYHAIRKEEKNGQMLWLWGDIETGDHKHMKVSFQQRRKEVVGDCSLLKTDVDSYNENFNKGEVIKLNLNFTNDVKETELAKASPKSSASVSKRPSSQSRCASSGSASSQVPTRP